jgi:hypothetical protein
MVSYGPWDGEGGLIQGSLVIVLELLGVPRF